MKEKRKQILVPTIICIVTILSCLFIEWSCNIYRDSQVKQVHILSSEDQRVYSIPESEMESEDWNLLNGGK